MKFEFMKDGKPLPTKGWHLSYDGNADTAYAPIHYNGVPVAMVMIKGEESIGQLVHVGNLLARGANHHKALISQLNDLASCVLSKQGEHAVMVQANRARDLLLAIDQ